MRGKVLLLFCFLNLIKVGCVKSEVEFIDDPVLYLFVDEIPKFDYYLGLENFIYSNLKWPKRFDGEGKVIASFIINYKGEVKRIKIEKSLSPGCDEEVIRILSLMPDWQPGKLDSNAVDVLMYIPVYFTIKR